MKRFSAVLGSLCFLSQFCSGGLVLFANPSTPPQYLWDQTRSTSSAEYAYRVAADASGNAYISTRVNGNLYGTTPENFSGSLLQKYSPTGELLWTNPCSKDYFGAMTVDSHGDLYVTSYETNSASVRKYSAGGELLWSAPFAMQPYISGNGITLDFSGNIIITGVDRNTPGGQPYKNSQAFITKLDPAGTVLWTKQYQNQGFEVGLNVATDSVGNIVMVGEISPLQSQLTYDNGIVVKYDADGNLLWSQKYGTSSSCIAASHVAIDAQDGIYVAGGSNESLYGETVQCGHHGFLMKLTPEGSQQWTSHFQCGGSAGGLALAPDGGAFVASFNGDGLFQFDSSGNQLWNITCQSHQTTTWDMAFGNNQIYLAGDQSVGQVGGYQDANICVFLVPEPSTVVLLIAGVVGLIGFAWQRRRYAT
jgi:outer membrane protein assembly factor BamB